MARTPEQIAQQWESLGRKDSMPDTIQANEQDRIIGELRFTDEWAGTRVERTDSKYGNDRVYAIDGLGEYTSVTSSLSVINKPRLADWRKNRALDKMQLLLPQQAKYQQLADEKNAKARKHKNNTWQSMMREEASKAPGEIMEASRVFGNESHELIELALLSNDVHVDPAYAHIYEGFTAWQRDTGLTVVATELMVWHSFHEYAGTIDMVVRTDSGVLGVIDIKTGGVFNEAAMQLAAYAKALQHLTGEPVEHAWVLQLPRERSTTDTTEELYQFVELANLPYWFDGFKAAKELAPYSEEEAWPQLQTS
jgi:hypothetical protein